MVPSQADWSCNRNLTLAAHPCDAVIKEVVMSVSKARLEGCGVSYFMSGQCFYSHSPLFLVGSIIWALCGPVLPDTHCSPNECLVSMITSPSVSCCNYLLPAAGCTAVEHWSLLNSLQQWYTVKPPIVDNPLYNGHTLRSLVYYTSTF